MKLIALGNAITCIVGATDAGLGEQLGSLTPETEVAFMKVGLASDPSAPVVYIELTCIHHPDPLCLTILLRLLRLHGQSRHCSLLQDHFRQPRFSQSGEWAARSPWDLDRCVLLRYTIPGKYLTMSPSAKIATPTI